MVINQQHSNRRFLVLCSTSWGQKGWSAYVIHQEWSRVRLAMRHGQRHAAAPAGSTVDFKPAAEKADPFADAEQSESAPIPCGQESAGIKPGPLIAYGYPHLAFAHQLQADLCPGCLRMLEGVEQQLPHGFEDQHFHILAQFRDRLPAKGRH